MVRQLTRVIWKTKKMKTFGHYDEMLEGAVFFVEKGDKCKRIEVSFEREKFSDGFVYHAIKQAIVVSRKEGGEELKKECDKEILLEAL